MSDNVKATAPDPFDLNAGVPTVEGPLRPRPALSDRISKRVVVVAVGVLSFIGVIWMLALDNMETRATAPKPVEEVKTAVTSAKPPKDLLGGDDTSAAKGGVPTTGSLTVGMAPSAVPESDIPPPKVPKSPDHGGSGAALTPAQQEAERVVIERRQREAQARMGGLDVRGFNESGTSVSSAAAMPSTAGANAQLAAAQERLAALQQTAAAQQSRGSPGGETQAGGDQEIKLRFVKEQEASKAAYHPFVPVPAQYANEVKAGTAISMVLGTGINSDLPGSPTARVSENVWDSVTGCRLLIPASTTVLGRYDSRVALGQDRNLTVWNHMIFEDGQELNLAGIQGYSPNGMSGLEADVDNHWLRIFGVALGMSVVTAGVQLSVQQPVASTTGMQASTNSQVVANALAQQYGQLGGQFMGKYLNIQPTLRNVPGERFLIIVPRTIVFSKVWARRC